MLRKTLLGLTMVGVALVTVPGTAMAATGAQTFRTLTIGSSPETVTRTIVGTGVINGAGTERILGQHELDNGGTQVNARWTFPRGTLLVTMIVNTNFSGPPMPPTCRISATITGTWTITGGTGAYAGASGGGTFTGLGRPIAKYDPATRTCSEDNALLFFNQRTFRGTLTVAGSAAA